MDLITLTLSKNHLWSALSVAGLGALTYFTNRYVKNTESTKNQTYYKPFETLQSGSGNVMLTNIINNSNNSIHINYIFWNGDMSSTYLLIDLLLQDQIIQPLYIERYSIIKELEKDKLESIARDNSNSNINNVSRLKDKNGNYKNKNNTKFLNNIASLKKAQQYEIKQIEILRLMILAQYPEFKNNLLPTTYITTIAKDLEYTTKFYNALLEIKPIHSEGIELIEQIVRFLKYYDRINKNNIHDIHDNMSRIILGCNKNYKNRELLIKLHNKKIISENNITINMPVFDMDDQTVKYMAIKFFPNDIMQYFMKKEI